MTRRMWKKPKQQQDNPSNTCDFPKNSMQQIRADSSSDDSTLLTSTEAAAWHVSVASDHIPSRDLWDGDATPPTTCNRRVTVQVGARSGVAPSWRNTRGMSCWRDEVTAGWRSLFFTSVLVLKREWNHEASSRSQKLIRSEVVVSRFQCVKSPGCETSTSGRVLSRGGGNKTPWAMVVNAKVNGVGDGDGSGGLQRLRFHSQRSWVFCFLLFAFESVWRAHSRLPSSEHNWNTSLVRVNGYWWLLVGFWMLDDVTSVGGCWSVFDTF